MSFVVIDNVTRRHPKGVVALDRVTLEIKQGEWLAVMGPSGSGKTTLLNLLGGLDRADEGRVIVDGLDLARISRPDLIRYRRECVGLVFQQFHLIPYLNASRTSCSPSTCTAWPTRARRSGRWRKSASPTACATCRRSSRAARNSASASRGRSS